MGMKESTVRLAAAGAGSDRDAVVVSAIVDRSGTSHVISCYGDHVWELWPHFDQSNRQAHQKKINWALIPADFREAAKAMAYAYWRKGVPGHAKPNAGSVRGVVYSWSKFFRQMESFGVKEIRKIKPLHLTNYASKLREQLSPVTVTRHLSYIALLWRFRDEYPDGLSFLPWEGTSPAVVGGFSLAGEAGRSVAKTPVIPLDVLQVVYAHAERLIADCDPLLLDLESGRRNYGTTFGEDIRAVRDACFFMIGILTGMRCSEISAIELRADRTEQRNGRLFHWLSSTEYKTKKGAVEYLMPAYCQKVLAVMERWSAPLRRQLRSRLREWERAATVNPSASLLEKIEQARVNLKRLFLVPPNVDRPPAVLTADSADDRMKKLALSAGVDWQLASHQLRRTYAWVFVRHQQGNLLFLKEQFKHTSIEMTQLYAANPSQDMGLYEEILEESLTMKEDVLLSWLDEDEPLSGGAGRRIISMRANVFDSRKDLIKRTAQSMTIRSTGHSWCLAQDRGCGGVGLYESTSCPTCSNGVIDRSFQAAWQGIYSHQRELLDVADELGPGAVQRVGRDLLEAARVLQDLQVETPA